MIKLTKKYISENGVVATDIKKSNKFSDLKLVEEFHSQIAIAVDGVLLSAHTHSYISKEHSLNLAYKEIQDTYSSYMYRREQLNV